MTIEQAVEILGINRRRNELASMVKALSFHPWANTAEDIERKDAATFVLRRWPAYSKHCNQARDSRYGR
jgi:hypothetical protein